MPWEKNFDVEKTLDKAMQAFWARGFEATSMQDLVDCTGVNRASLYATYGDKRALFIASLHLYDQNMRKARLAKLEQQSGPRAAIKELFEGFIRYSRSDGSRGCFLTNTALELAAHDPEIGRIVAESQADLENFFRRMIKKGQTLGEIAADIDPATIARGLLASLLGLLVLARSRPERALLQSIVDEALRHLG